MRKLGIPLVALFFASSVGPAGAAIRECEMAGPGDLVGRIDVFSPETYAMRPRVELIVDEERRGEIEVVGDGFDLQYQKEDGTTTRIPARDILWVEVGCNDVPVMIHVLTKAGAVPFMQRHLLRLLDAQESYRRFNGRYATRIRDIRRPVDTMMATRTRMRSSGGGWSATVQVRDFPTSCTIEVSPAGVAGEVSCGPAERNR